MSEVSKENLSFDLVGTSLVVDAQARWPPRPGDTPIKQHDSDSTSSGSLDKSYHVFIRPVVEVPPPAKRSAIRSNLGAQNFNRGEKMWKRVNRQSLEED